MLLHKLAITLTFFSLIASLYADDLVAVKSSVNESWNNLAASAATAQIQYLNTTFSCNESGKTPEQVRQIVERLNPAKPAEIMEELVRQFSPEIFAKQQAHNQKESPWQLWDQQILLDDGFQERSSGLRTEHLVTQGVHLMRGLQNNQVTCYLNGECRYFYYGRDWFLAIPIKQAMQTVSSYVELDQQLELRWDGGGFLRLDSTHHTPLYGESYNAAGQLFKTSHYLEPTTYPGDVTLPAVRIEINYREGVAVAVEATAIESAEFNLAIPAAEFNLSIPKGGVLIDAREEKSRVRRVNDDVANVTEYFLASAYAPHLVPTPAPPRQFDWKAFLLIANGLFLIIVGLILWKRAK